MWLLVLGSSTTQLYANLSQVLDLPPESELVVSQIDHEANISSWIRLARLQNLKVIWWKPAAQDEDGSMLLTPENLRPLLSPKTKLVTCTHASNILGGIHDIKAIAECVHTEVGLFLKFPIPHKQGRKTIFGIAALNFFSLPLFPNVLCNSFEERAIMGLFWHALRELTYGYLRRSPAQ